MDNQFDSKGGEQNIGQGDHTIGKQENNHFRCLLGRIFTTGNQSPAIVAGGNAAVTYGLSPEDAGKLAKKLLAPLQGQLEAKDQQLKALTEAITAVSKTGAPAASIEAALQALQQGDTAKAEELLKADIRGNTFNNSFNSGGGQQIIAQGTGAIGQQINTYNITQQQVSVEELQKLLKLVTEIKARLPEKAQAKLRNEVPEQ